MTQDLTWRVVNAEQRAKRSPGTFQLPPLEARRGLSLRDFAKVILAPIGQNAGERVWVEIAAVTGVGYIGVTRNKPVDKVLPKYDSPVSFGPEHIIDVHRRGEPWPAALT